MSSGDKRYGIINEIGDMGLGFNELTPKDQKTVNEQARKDQKALEEQQKPKK